MSKTSSTRISIYIKESDQDVLNWFEEAGRPSEAVIQLIRGQESKDREIQLLKELIEQQKETIELLKAVTEGTTIQVVRSENKEKDSVATPEPQVEEEEDMSIGADAANNLLGAFGV